ncbi:MAG: 3-dehydroquinate synthase [Alysiella sp.]|uniref:3-dehydroquinate synthase n=1 Tax=Alysiella sp. TaxID=1872483 RepID=UPI0026DACB9F|nr:3-dehydroquinate synthase [Alysiella sp.]MDO4434661.1 3-dehydroquinate synthase [Alysiella sp.]
MQTLTVAAASHAYPIYIGSRLLSQFECFKPHLHQKAVIVSNQTVADIYAGSLKQLLDKNGIEYSCMVLPDGEQHKNHESLNQIYTTLLQQRADRKTTLIALGGGVIGDMAGFAAATYQRGMPFIQIPTTLLAQVDSSVGGKTAINHPLGKNMIGAFYQPQAVIADIDVLHTLPERELSAGLAEVIKYALLGDVDFLLWLEHNMAKLMQRDADALTYAIRHCCRMKADIVARDETEQNVRALLNLGHTFGHAIETELGYGVWLHGEAVAAGMVLACHLSEQMGLIGRQDTERVQVLLRQAALPDVPPKFAWEKWLANMSRDKKVQNGTLRFVTLKKLGQAQISAINDMSLLKKALHLALT